MDPSIPNSVSPDSVKTMSLAGASLLILLAVATVGFYLWLRRGPPSAISNPALNVFPVSSPDKNGTEPDVDIIAIHGLGTKSPDTWVWKDKEHKTADVNWLSDPHMLPSKVGSARIFTCDWPAEMFQPSSLTQKTNEEFARLLLNGIKRRPRATNDRRIEDQPILFIASCLGGVMLMKALDMAGKEYKCIRTATRGIVFLGTPFGGTSFQDVAKWAEPYLRARALFRGREVTKLLDSVKESFDLDELVRRFTQLCQEPAHPYQVMTFYELGKTNLYNKVFPFPLPFGAKLLVDKLSATLQMVPDPLPLHKTHVLMNKFYGPEDSDYATVASKIEEFLQKIRKKEADDWIRDKTYTPEKIKIERLSGDLLPMDKCYINLAIVERLGQGIDREEEEAEEEGPTASPFSLLARQKLQAPRKSMQVELATVFSDRRGSDGRTMQPRRILIRGRAGVGKTTLCKKIVHEFYRGTWSEWTRIFDRILWVPLRNLKLEERRLVAGYSFEHLLEHEFFAIPNRRLDLVKELSDILARESSKTLFLLDGLDEISGDLGGSDDMSRFLKELLKQPNVIITSRPSANPPPDMDLELETIGFYPEQVRDYLGADPEMGPKAEEVMRFLEKHWLIGSLVRIPIQLDAFCCAWDDLNSEPVPSTMTGIYTAITQSLLKKDSVRLSRTPEGELTSQLHPFEIEKKLEPEIILLEYLAFNGLHCDIIEFTRSHLRKIGPRAPPLSSSSLDGTLSRLSFLRVSDHSSKRHNPSYHFLHLTFQEYFAARYFARKWTSGQFLDCFNFQSGQNESIEAKAFLQGEKYNARYDILWRFVTGLLAAQKPEYLRDFVDVIEDEPRDLFGPAHERLLMHCLNEMALSKNNDSLKKLRQTIERRCHEWSIYEYERCGRMHLCRESEFPDRVVSDMLSDASSVPDVMSFFLDALGSRPQLQKSILEELVGVLKDSHETKVRGSAIRVLVRQSPLPDNILQALALLLEHTDPEISYSASTVLQEHPSMSESILQALKLLLEHTDYKVRYSAARILLKQSSLPDNIIQALILQVEHTDSEVRNSAYSALERQCSLPENIIQALFLQLEHIDAKVRHSTTRVLRKQSSLPENIIQALVLRLDHTDSEVRKSAYSTLEGQSSLPHNIIQDLFLRLEHTDSTVRHSITRVLQEQSSLPHNIIQFFASRLQDANEDVRVCTIEVLGGHPLSDNIINALISQLEDANDRVRVSAIEALGKQPLSDNIINALASRLLDTEDYIRASAIEVLGKQSSSDNIINALASRLQDASDYVRASAVEALGKQPLSANIINALASRLQDAENYVRVSAIEALGKQPLTDNIINALASQLQDTEDYVRVSATRVLWKQSSLPEIISSKFLCHNSMIPPVQSGSVLLRL